MVAYEFKFNLGQFVYQLVAVVNHLGNTETGHYTCFTYDEKSSEWMFYNDEIVTLIKNSNSIRSNANYILVYKKI